MGGGVGWWHKGEGGVGGGGRPVGGRVGRGVGGVGGVRVHSGGQSLKGGGR